MSTFFESLSITQTAVLWAGLFGPLVFKSSVVLGLLLVATRILRTASASTRHFLWAVGTAALLLLPFLQTGLPSWRILPLPEFERVAVLPVDDGVGSSSGLVPASDPSAAAALPAGESPAPESTGAAGATPDTFRLPADPARTQGSARSFVAAALSVPAVVWVFSIWMSGMLLLTTVFLCGLVRVRHLKREAEPLAGDGWPALLRTSSRTIGLATPPALLCSPRDLTPMTWGVSRPFVLLPRECWRWSTEQRREILLHELAHVQRRDCMTQLGAQFVCLIHWFNPLAWAAARRMRIERERACDDIVLMSGTRPSSYASHLLDIAQHLGTEERTLSAGLAMARRSRMFDRLDAVLDPELRRLAPGRGMAATAAAVVLAIVLPLAILGPSAQAIGPRGATHSTSVAVDPPAPPAPPASPAPPTPPGAPTPLPAEPSLPTLPSLPSVPSVPTLSTNGSSHIRIDGSNLQVSWTSDDDGGSWRLEMEGEIEFKEDDSGIERMSDDARFELEEKHGSRRISVEATPGEGGRPVYEYRVDRKDQPFDDEAAQWLARGLQRTLLELGINAEERVRRTYERDGAPGVLKLIDRVDSDYAARIYYTEYFSLDRLRDEDIRAGLEQMARKIDSDYEMASVLSSQVDVLLSSEGSTQAFADCASSIDSDYEKARVLTVALDREDSKPEEVAALLRTAVGIDSDYEASRVLSTVDPHALSNETVSQAYFATLEGVDSDYEKARVLTGLARHVGNDEKLREACRRAADGIDSSYEHSRVERALR